MIVIKTVEKARLQIEEFARQKQEVGFVPTMGALHEGHLTLIKSCQEAFPVCVSSVFINPAQFNNPEDFKKYPVTIEKDIDMLEAAGCDMLFLPSVTEIYPAGNMAKHYDLGHLEQVLEGKYQPGHFQGVCQVVDRLLNIIKPTALFLGQKDYQQCLVIKKMIALEHHPVKVIVLPTTREGSGLAMSSRNMRLAPAEKIQAEEISRTLFYIQKNFRHQNADELIKNASAHLLEKGFRVDYVAIVNAETLAPLQNNKIDKPAVALIAVYLGDIRLIDNLSLT